MLTLLLATAAVAEPDDTLTVRVGARVAGIEVDTRNASPRASMLRVSADAVCRLGELRRGSQVLACTLEEVTLIGRPERPEHAGRLERALGGWGDRLEGALVELVVNDAGRVLRADVVAVTPDDAALQGLIDQMFAPVDLNAREEAAVAAR